MTNSIQEVLNKSINARYVRIIPSIDIDSLIAAGILAKYIIDNNGNASISLDPRIIHRDKVYTVIIGFDKAVPEDSSNNIDVITSRRDSSITAYMLKYINNIQNRAFLEKLTLVTGQYRMLDLGEEGFKGIEKEFLNKLVDADEAESIFMFKLWGFKRTTVKNMVYRTLYPFLLGVSGEIDIAEKIHRSVPGIVDPESAKAFVQELFSNLESKHGIRDKVLYKLVGYTYMINMFSGIRFDTGTILGTLLIYLALGFENPLKIAYIPFNEEILLHLTIFYEEYIDIIASELSMIIKQIVHEETNIVETDYIVRPELIIDALNSIDSITLLDDKPLIIRNNGIEYTCMRELLRIGESFNNAVEKCNEYQICKVE